MQHPELPGLHCGLPVSSVELVVEPPASPLGENLDGSTILERFDRTFDALCVLCLILGDKDDAEEADHPAKDGVAANLGLADVANKMLGREQVAEKMVKVGLVGNAPNGGTGELLDGNAGNLPGEEETAHKPVEEIEAVVHGTPPVAVKEHGVGVQYQEDDNQEQCAGEVRQCKEHEAKVHFRYAHCVLEIYMYMMCACVYVFINAGVL